MRLTDIHLSPEWESLAERALQADGPILVIGARDAGKSALARHLLGRLVAQRGTAALLDGDVALPTVGLPGLLGLSLVADVDSLDERARADRTCWVGASHPGDRLVAMVVGHTHLMALTRETGIPTVVDTTSALSARHAKELTLALYDIVRPSLVAGVTHGAESDHLLAPLERLGAPIVRVPASPRARPKPQSYREHLSAERIAAYFEEAREIELDLGRYAVDGALLGSGVPLDGEGRAELERGLDVWLIEAERAGDAISLVTASEPHDERADIVLQTLECADIAVVEAAATNGLMTGLVTDDGECIGVGLIDAWKGDGVVSLYTPLDDAQLEQVRRVAFGSLRVGRSGESLGTWSRERSLGGGADAAVAAADDDD